MPSNKNGPMGNDIQEAEIHDIAPSILEPPSDGHEHHPTTKTLDYIALGIILAPAPEVISMYLHHENIDLVRVAISFLFSIVIGALVLWFAHGWKSVPARLDKIRTGMSHADDYFWVRALVIAFFMIVPSILSPFIFYTTSEPSANQQEISDLRSQVSSLQSQLSTANQQRDGIQQQLVTAKQQTQSAPQTPKRETYSEAEREELRNAMRALSKLLESEGTEIDTKTTSAFQSWANLINNRGEIPEPDLALLMSRLDDLRKSLNTFDESLFDENGPLKEYMSYKDELSSVIKISQNGNDPISNVGYASTRLKQRISVIDEAALKHSDPQLIHQMIGMDAGVSDLQNALKQYSDWMNETKGQIEIFRRSLD